MRQVLKPLLLVLLLTTASALVGVANAQTTVEDSDAENVQSGDNESETDQNGRSQSGDAVAGQVVGVVSAGDASVDATNRSEDVEAESGDAEGSNSATTFTGLLNAEDAEIGGDGGVDLSDVTIEDSDVANVQEGDNESEVSQTADAITGAAVCGQVLGVVTAAGGSADVVAANTTVDAGCETGDAEFNNDLVQAVGLINVEDDGVIIIPTGVINILDTGQVSGLTFDGLDDGITVGARGPALPN